MADNNYQGKQSENLGAKMESCKLLVIVLVHEMIQM